MNEAKQGWRWRFREFFKQIRENVKSFFRRLRHYFSRKPSHKELLRRQTDIAKEQVIAAHKFIEENSLTRAQRMIVDTQPETQLSLAQLIAQESQSLQPYSEFKQRLKAARTALDDFLLQHCRHSEVRNEWLVHKQNLKAPFRCPLTPFIINDRVRHEINHKSLSAEITPEVLIQVDGLIAPYNALHQSEDGQKVAILHMRLEELHKTQVAEDIAHNQEQSLKKPAERYPVCAKAAEEDESDQHVKTHVPFPSVHLH